VSRTQRFDFRKVNLSDLIKLLKFVCAENGVKASDEALLNIAHAADGSFRDSLSLLDQVMGFAQGELTPELSEQVLGLTGLKATAEYLGLLINNQTKEAVNYISGLHFQGRDLHQFQRDFLEYLRKIMLIKVGNAPEADYTEEIRDMMRQQASSLGWDRLLKIIAIYQRAGNEIKSASLPSLPLEVAGVEATAQAAPAASVPKADNSVSQAGQSVESPADNPEMLQAVIGAWPSILEKIKEYNHSLISSMKLAVPASVEGSRLFAVFPYKFHKDAVEARKNKIVIDQVLEEVLGHKLFILPVLSKEWTKPLPENFLSEQPKDDNLEIGQDDTKADMVESALKIMGGEVE
jgi:DNA polymerase-3 subunit gamma/tau